MVSGANGNARLVLGRMLSMYQTTKAATKDRITHAHDGILLAQEFLLFLNSGLPFQRLYNSSWIQYTPLENLKKYEVSSYLNTYVIFMADPPQRKIIVLLIRGGKYQVFSTLHPANPPNLLQV